MTAIIGYFSIFAASEWTPDSQARMENPSSPVVSPDGAWAAYTVSTVTGAAGNLTAAGALKLDSLAAARSKVSTQAPVQFCTDGSCSSPTLSSTGTLFFLKNGDLYRSDVSTTTWSAPVVAQTLGAARGAISAYSISPDSKTVATTYAEMGTYSTTEGRVITTDVIVNVITGTPQPQRNILCVGPTAESSSPAHCYESLNVSVGMEGWRISCWPYDSSMSWSEDGKTLALTVTADRLANAWESVHVVTIDTTKPPSTSRINTVTVAADIAFQPFFHPDGVHLALTQSVSSNYTWSQTWRLCVATTAVGHDGDAVGVPLVCDTTGTFDEMPTIVGWTPDGTGILYVEQRGTSVELFEMPFTPATGFGAFERVNVDVPAGGVIGGGFRSTSRVTVSASGMLGLTWEDPVTPQQAFVGKWTEGSSPISVIQISTLNAAAKAHRWPYWSVHKWMSDDGTPVEGIMLEAGVMETPATSNATTSSTTPPPLIVITHCGPAMASLATFIGAGSVCARFPLATWAERGYTVLMPNYRGSTGYGAEFRNADFKGWGAGDYEDVMSSFVSLSKTGKASLDNAAHVGWSYGGYTSALALTKAKTTHGIHLKAVIGGGSLTDLISQVGTTDISKIFQSSNAGYYWDDAQIAANFMERSAMYHVQNASAPTLLFHGTCGCLCTPGGCLCAHLTTRIRLLFLPSFILLPSSEFFRTTRSSHADLAVVSTSLRASGARRDVAVHRVSRLGAHSGRSEPNRACLDGKSRVDGRALSGVRAAVGARRGQAVTRAPRDQTKDIPFY
jgi:dipeptidyl aminopeptidase/acylaminoacyl peptidase